MSKRRPSRFEYATIVGLPAAIAVVLLAQVLEGAPTRALWQPTAALVVFGGTLAAMLVSYPQPSCAGHAVAIKDAFVSREEPVDAVLAAIIQYSQVSQTQGAHRARDRDRSGGRSVPEHCARAGRRWHEREGRAPDSRNRKRRPPRTRRGSGRRARDRGRLHADARHSRRRARADSRDAEPQRSVEARQRHRRRVRRDGLRRGDANLVLLPLATKLRGAARRAALTRELIIEGMIAVQEGLNPRLIEQKLRGFLVVTEQDGAARRVA